MARNVANVANSLAGIGEIVAGSTKELQQVEIIKGYLENHVDSLHLEPVEVTAWNEHYCLIYIDGELHRCSVHPPYEGYADLEVDQGKIIYLGGFEDVVELNHADDKVIVVEGIYDPNYVAVYSHAMRGHRPLAMVFVDRFDALRRIVVVEDLVPRYNLVKPPSAPAIHVDRKTGEKLRKANKVRIALKTELRPSYGYNVIAELHGTDSGALYLTAHHDHWFSGATDDIIGVSVLVELASSSILRMLLRNSIVIAFFTAEEGLSNPLVSFYWLVGSRKHVASNVHRILDEVSLAVNVDAVYGDSVRFSTSNLISRGYLLKLGVDMNSIDHESIMYDSYAFTLLGIPSITIHNYEKVLNAGLYHSTLDVVEKLSSDNLATGVINALLMLVKGFRLVQNLDQTELLLLGAKTMTRELALRTDLPLEARLYLHNFLKNLISSDIHKMRRYLPAFHRVITSTCISKEVFKGRNIYEITSYAFCKDDCMPVPSVAGMSADCYENLLHNLESLAYILQGVYFR